MGQVVYIGYSYGEFEMSEKAFRRKCSGMSESVRECTRMRSQDVSRNVRECSRKVYI